MDPKTLEYLYQMFAKVTREEDWKAAMDRMLSSLREEFVYDNVAVYVQDEDGSLDVIYARAVGRGKSAEADAAWGEGIANEILSSKKMILHEPGKIPAREDRIAHAYLLGLPLYIGGHLRGAIVFIRFGGPSFSDSHIGLAHLLSYWAASLYERRKLQDAHEELQAAQRQMRLQDDFVSTISHEFRTPLGVIMGFGTSLLREDANWDKETEREFLGLIVDESERLNQLVENLLGSSRLKSKTMPFQFAPIRLDALARDVTARAQTRQRDLAVDLDFDSLPPTLGDSERMTQVFENLFSNAMKYAPGSPLKISMRHHGNKILISFADQGEGIPEEYLSFLFDRFYRVPGDKSVTGTGLGLYICRQIILAHHGKIWAESALDRGTTFFIELPVLRMD